MAGNDEDLVSQVSITGADASSQQLETLASRGGAALDKLAASAARADLVIAGASKGISKNTQEAATATSSLGNVAISPNIASSISRVESEARKLGSSMRTTVQAVGRFAQRLTLVGAAAAAGSIALARAAANVAKSVDGQSTSLDKATQSQIDANNSALQGELAANAYQTSLHDLQVQLNTGQISYAQYTAQLANLSANFREQQRVAAETANAQDRVTEANDRLTKSLAQQKALNDLIDKFGGPLTTSLLAFGRQIEGTRQSIVSSFGPGVAAVIDVISNALGTNAAAIGKFFDQASKKMQDFIAKNGPAIQKALENIGAAAASVFNGLIDAGPALLDFINNQVTPAINGVVKAFGDLADLINSIFGTKVTGGFLILIVVLTQLVGGFRLMFGLLRLGVGIFSTISAIVGAFVASPLAVLLITIGLIVGAFILLFAVDWKGFAERAKSAIGVVLQFFTNLKDGAVALWDRIKQGFSDLIDWFAAAPARIGQFFTDLWATIQQGAADAAQWVVDKWNSVVQFFAGLPATLQGVWDTVKQSIIDAFETAVLRLKVAFNNLRVAAVQQLQPIIDLLNAINQLSGGAGAIGAESIGVGAATGGHIRGPGTSTSDSIPAWLSDNEFVMQAKSVAKYGVGLMNAINSGTFRMPRFALGGPINMIAPVRGRTHFAEGGLASKSGMQPLNLSLFGEQFNGLMMPDDVAGRLTKFAVARQARSGGRKPGWVGGPG